MEIITSIVLQMHDLRLYLHECMDVCSGRVRALLPRTICCGPGISETDFSFMKNIPVNERTHFEFRAEMFNVFNHTQFYNPDGTAPTALSLARSQQVKDPRLAQFALKFYF